jgi:N-acyl-D-amino-acid deacylase
MRAVFIMAVGSLAWHGLVGSNPNAAIGLVRQSSITYIAQKECFSCHHQALPLWVMARCSPLESIKVIEAQSAFTLEYFKGLAGKLSQGQGVPGGPYTAGYALLGLAEAEVRPDGTTQALVKYLLETQQKDGSWRILTHRPPLEDSHFTATALAIQGLQNYSDTVGGQVEAGANWLRINRPDSTEGHAFRLLGLYWAGKDTDDAGKALLSLQREEGGWAQLPVMESDAYATGQALVALLESGQLSESCPAFELGKQWLARHQQPDGTWLVQSRSKPIQKYFESGFPHGKDQFISISATCWALLATEGKW